MMVGYPGGDHACVLVIIITSGARHSHRDLINSSLIPIPLKPTFSSRDHLLPFDREPWKFESLAANSNSVFEFEGGKNVVAELSKIWRIEGGWSHSFRLTRSLYTSPGCFCSRLRMNAIGDKEIKWWWRCHRLNSWWKRSWIIIRLYFFLLQSISNKFIDPVSDFYRSVTL